MLRISGVVLPDNKTLVTALTYIYGVGHSSAVSIVKKANIDAAVRVKDLSPEEEVLIRSLVESESTVEGDLRSQISADIRRLKNIESYRGSRHSQNLPARGQRTKTNARTRRGKKITVGSGRKKSSEKT